MSPFSFSAYSLTSSSMSAHELDRALTEISAIVTTVVPGDSVRVLSVDTDVHTDQQIHHSNQIRLEGAGGTNMDAGIATAAETKPDAIVVITDGWTPWSPTKPPGARNVIAALTDDRGIEQVPDWDPNHRHERTLRRLNPSRDTNTPLPQYHETLERRDQGVVANILSKQTPPQQSWRCCGFGGRATVTRRLRSAVPTLGPARPSRLSSPTSCLLCACGAGQQPLQLGVGYRRFLSFRLMRSGRCSVPQNRSSSSVSRVAMVWRSGHVRPRMMLLMVWWEMPVMFPTSL